MFKLGPYGIPYLGHSHFLATPAGIHIDTIDVPCLVIVPVEAQFIHYIQGDQQETGQADGQSDYIDKGEHLVTHKVPPGDF
jgi:hypothetical protein